MDAADLIPAGLCQCGCGAKTGTWRKSQSSAGRVKGEHARYVHGHQRRKPGPDYEARDCGYETPCWVWVKTKLNSGGYGLLRLDGHDRLAHRVYYERAEGPITAGLVIDHLCRVRACVNPAHMETVTNVENVMRGESVPARRSRQTHCKRGHEFTPENTYVSDKGHRDCRMCHREDQRAYKARLAGTHAGTWEERDAS